MIVGSQTIDFLQKAHMIDPTRNKMNETLLPEVPISSAVNSTQLRPEVIDSQLVADPKQSQSVKSRGRITPPKRKKENCFRFDHACNTISSYI